MNTRHIEAKSVGGYGIVAVMEKRLGRERILFGQKHFFADDFKLLAGQRPDMITIVIFIKTTTCWVMDRTRCQSCSDDVGGD
jgi:hypothetical protein